MPNLEDMSGCSRCVNSPGCIYDQGAGQAPEGVIGVGLVAGQGESANPVAGNIEALRKDA
jgi:hypothetical protein